MPYLIKDDRTLEALDHLSRKRGMPKAEVLRSLLRAELDHDASQTPVRELLAPIISKVAEIGIIKRITEEEDKRISDELWGQ